MSHCQPPPSDFKQCGLSLIELMVALVISLVLLGALTYILLAGRLLGKVDNDVSRMQENGRYAMETIGRAIRQAGYRLDVTKPLAASAIEGTDGGESSDTITLRHDPMRVPDSGNALKGKEANCASGIIESDNDVNASTGEQPANGKLVVYAFSISRGQLRCGTLQNDGGNDSAMIADGIEDMQIEYGIDPAGNGTITAYSPASATLNFSQVAAVRVSLLLKGETPGQTPNATQTLYFNGASVTKTDGFLRQAYTATFTVRNRAK
jgi:type IV pilus assembly protein PilW